MLAAPYNLIHSSLTQHYTGVSVPAMENVWPLMYRFYDFLALLPWERLQWNKTGEELNKTSQQKPCWETTHSIVYLLQSGVLTLQSSSEA